MKIILFQETKFHPQKRYLSFAVKLLALLLSTASGLVSAQVLVQDDFNGSVGTTPNASQFEWSGQVGENGSGQLYLSTDTSDQSTLSSIASARPASGQTLVFQMRAYAYAENWNPGVYGDKQPRGLRVGSDANNAVEFYSASSTSIGMRVRKDGIESGATYAASVDTMRDYEISITTTSAVFKVDGVLAATFTDNIPTGLLNVYVSTWDGGGVGNVPVSLDSLSLTLSNNFPVLPMDLTFITNNGAITITGYTGSVGTVTIPDTINGLPVTSIRPDAFSYRSSLTSITIGNNVTNIEDSAFYYCTSLTNINLGNSVTRIGNWAFYSCGGLTSIAFPDSVTSIGNDAFYYCTHLTNLTVGNNVTNIGKEAFLRCYGLTSVTTGDGVVTVGDSAFAYCTSLASVTLGNSVTRIGSDAYPVSAFDNCNALSAITVNGGNRVYSSVEGILFNQSQDTLVLCPRARTGVYPIPNSVTSIGTYAFSYCIYLTDVTIPDSVTQIGGSAFDHCGGLTNVTIGNSVTNIGNGAFWSTGLRSLTIPHSVTTIESSAFGYCDGLTDVTIPDSVTSLGDNAFYRCNKLVTVTIPNSVTNIGSAAFSGTGLTSVTIPNSVTSLANDLFNDCAHLDSITIPGTITSIGWEAFYSCISLTNVTIPVSVINIGYKAFYNCPRLTSVTIPNGVTTVGSEAFHACNGLTNVTVGSGVTSIQNFAFADCTRLTGIYFKGNAPSLGSSVFVNTGATAYYFPGTTGWQTFAQVAGVTTVLWNPMAQSFGVQENRFGFNITGASNLVLVVEVCTNLANPTWAPVNTNTLTGDSFYFSDPQWTNSIQRFYRLRPPVGN